MPFVPNFTTSQSTGTPGVIYITDTSTGALIGDTITQRRIYIQLANGSYLVPTGTTTSYVNYPLGDDTIAVNVLKGDTAASITIQWLNASNVVLFSKEILVGFTAYGETFLYTLTEAQSSAPAIVQDTNYLFNKYKMRVAIDDGNQAVSLAADIQSAQLSYDIANFMRDNQSKYF